MAHIVDGFQVAPLQDGQLKVDWSDSAPQVNACLEHRNGGLVMVLDRDCEFVANYTVLAGLTRVMFIPDGNDVAAYWAYVHLAFDIEPGESLRLPAGAL